MKAIAFSGTLDPITNGHMWVIGEARALADEVIVFLSENPFKKPLFPAEDRQRIVERSVAERGWTNVRVTIVRDDYTARAAKRHGIDYLIRGMRNTADFDYENLIQQANVDVLHGAKTIFVMPPRDLGSVSSSFVRGLQGPVGWHWTTRQFIPGPAYQAWILAWLRTEWHALWPGEDEWFRRLTGPAAYGGPDRHYHNLDHLVHGLTEIGIWAANTGRTLEDTEVVKKAFWFHDAVYVHGHQEVSNEEASARLWLGSRLPGGRADEVASLIRATDHFQAAAIDHPLKSAMLSADLAILGQNPQQYDAYASAIREEYAEVPEQVYREHRTRALRTLRDKAERADLFTDAWFASLYSEWARGNLERELHSLQ